MALGHAARAPTTSGSTRWPGAAGIQVCQTRVFSPLLFELPGTREHGLARENVQSGGNDRQLQMTYTPSERLRLCELAAHWVGCPTTSWMVGQLSTITFGRCP